MATLSNNRGSAILSVLTVASIGFLLFHFLISKLAYTETISQSSRWQMNAGNLQAYVRAKIHCDDTRKKISVECNIDNPDGSYIELVSKLSDSDIFVTKPQFKGEQLKTYSMVGPFAIRAKCICNPAICGGPDTASIRIEYAILGEEGRGRQDPLNKKNWDWAPLYVTDAELGC